MGLNSPLNARSSFIKYSVLLSIFDLVEHSCKTDSLTLRPMHCWIVIILSTAKVIRDGLSHL